MSAKSEKVQFNQIFAYMAKCLLFGKNCKIGN